MTAGQIVFIFSQWAVLTVLARRADPEAVGQFALALAIAAPVVLLSRLNLRSVLASDARQSFHYDDYHQLRLIMSVLSVIVIAAIALAGGYTSTTFLTIAIVAAARGAESLSDVCYGLFQSIERLDWLVRSLILRSIGTLTLGMAALYLTPTAVVAGLALAVPWSLVYLLHDLPLTRRSKTVSVENERVKPEPRRSTLVRLFWLALPLGAVTMGASLIAMVPRYFIERLMGDASLGIFAALAYASVPGTTLANALGETVIARLSRRAAAGETWGFIRLVGWAAGLALGVAIGGVAVAHLFGEWLLDVTYGPEYAEHADVLIWIMVAAGVAYLATVVIHALTAARRFRIQMPVALVALLVQVVACAYLIPLQGMVGAVKALVLARLCQFIGSGMALAITLLSPGGTVEKPATIALGEFKHQGSL